jgi:hypothetical protein
VSTAAALPVSCEPSQARSVRNPRQITRQSALLFSFLQQTRPIVTQDHPHLRVRGSASDAAVSDC